MSRFILSIDQGTTSCRAILFDADGKTIATGQKEFSQYFPQAGWVEHDALEILNTQLECIATCIKTAAIDPAQIACVGITNQRETTVVWDKTTGKPIHNAIVWQCRRTQELADQLRSDSIFRERTGLVPDAYFSGPKIKWILDNVKGADTLAQDGKLLFGTIDTWLIWNLTGRQTHATEPSNASRTMVFNIHTLAWDDELLARLNIPKKIMPAILPSNGNFGTTKKELVGFNAPITGVLGDQQAALFGQACFMPGSAKCTYGTGSFILENIGTTPHLIPGLLTTIAWHLEGAAAVYGLEGAIFIAGAAIQWLRDSLQIIESSDQVEQLAASIDSNEGVYFVPALVGLGSPWWDSNVRGAIVGLTRGSGRAHLVRAAMEAMAYQVTDVAGKMQEHDCALKELRIDGGAVRNNLLVQFQADLLGIPVIRSGQLESTAWGVAALAGLKANLLKDQSTVEKLWQADRTFNRINNQAAQYAGWQSALGAAFAAASTASPQLKIAAAKAEQVPALEKIVNYAYRGGKQTKSWTGEEHLIKGARITTDELLELIADTGKHLLVAADCSDNVLGCIVCEIQGESAYIGMLAVDPDAQSGGIGKKLMLAAEDLARALGKQAATMCVVSGRPELQNWYERIGYKPTGETAPFKAGGDTRFTLLKSDLHFITLKKCL